MRQLISPRTETAFIESFNGRLRDERLKARCFLRGNLQASSANTTITNVRTARFEDRMRRSLPQLHTLGKEKASTSWEARRMDGKRIVEGQKRSFRFGKEMRAH